MFYRGTGSQTCVYKGHIHTAQGASRLYTANTCGLLYNRYPTELFLKKLINT